MELRRELLLTVGALVVLNLFLAFGAIALFVRMGPAIERILEENVVTIGKAEDLLSELALAHGGEPQAERWQRMAAVVSEIQQNVSEPNEQPVVDALERHLEEARAGDVEAREKLVGDIRELIRVNREAMHRVDGEAQRLGSAGAWAAVLIGFVSFFLSLLLLVRLQNRLVSPLLDLYQVLEAARRGNRMRRCRSADAPREVRQVTQSVNGLLDERLHAR